MTAAAVGSPDAQDGQPTLPTHEILLGTDPERPGAGVASVEEVRRGGAEGAGPVAVPIGRPRRCSVYRSLSILNSITERLGPQRNLDVEARPVRAGDMARGTEYHLECRYVDDGRVSYLDRFRFNPARPAGRPRVDAIARQVYAEVPLAYPNPRTSPPVDAPQLVGFPIWLWLDDGVWRDFDASASVAGVTVTVTAQPERTEWTMGDGTRVTCDGPGRPWARRRPDATTSCSHTYQFVSDDQPGGRYPAQVSLTWSVRWEASTGERGTLPDASRTTGFDLDVRQRQAIIDYGR